MLLNLAGERAAKISFILITVEGKQQQFWNTTLSMLIEKYQGNNLA